LLRSRCLTPLRVDSFEDRERRLHAQHVSASKRRRDDHADSWRRARRRLWSSPGPAGEPGRGVVRVRGAPPHRAPQGGVGPRDIRRPSRRRQFHALWPDRPGHL